MVFDLPNPDPNTWLRVRDEGDKITLSLKSIQGNKITDQKEICLKIDNFGNALNLLENLGCQKKSYQETKREIWKLNGCEIMIDEWPFLEPFIEIEGGSEKLVKSVSEQLGFNWNEAIFDSVTPLYMQKYSISAERINQKTPMIKFEMENPFL